MIKSWKLQALVQCTYADLGVRNHGSKWINAYWNVHQFPLSLTHVYIQFAFTAQEAASPGSKTEIVPNSRNFLNFGEVGINFRSQGDGRFGVRVEGSQRETQKFYPIKFVLVFFFLVFPKSA